MLAIWRSGNKVLKKSPHSVVTFLKPSKGKLSAQLSTSDRASAVLIFPLLFVLIFLPCVLD